MNPEEAARLGVPENLFTRLKSGDEVELPNGRRVQPAEVVSQPRPGRMFFYGAALPQYFMELSRTTERETGSVAFDPEDTNPDNQVETSHFFHLIDV